MWSFLPFTIFVLLFCRPSPLCSHRLVCHSLQKVLASTGNDVIPRQVAPFIRVEKVVHVTGHSSYVAVTREEECAAFARQYAGDRRPIELVVLYTRDQVLPSASSVVIPTPTQTHLPTSVLPPSAVDVSVATSVGFSRTVFSCRLCHFLLTLLTRHRHQHLATPSSQTFSCRKSRSWSLRMRHKHRIVPRRQVLQLLLSLIINSSRLRKVSPCSLRVWRDWKLVSQCGHGMRCCNSMTPSSAWWKM